VPSAHFSKTDTSEEIAKDARIPEGNARAAVNHHLAAKVLYNTRNTDESGGWLRPRVAAAIVSPVSGALPAKPRVWIEKEKGPFGPFPDDVPVN
jgi:hypothetical protein